MKGVSNEGSNTDKMRQHQMMKANRGEPLRHEEVDLMMCTDLIDQARSSVLNGHSAFATLTDVLAANPEDKPLASDVDQQLLLKIFFKEKVNLSSVCLRFSKPPEVGGEDDEEHETYAKPRLVKLFGNQPDMDFSDIDDVGSGAEAVTEGEDAVEMKISCVGHRFQRLESLVVFVEEAMDPEASRTFLNRVVLVGHQAADYHAQYK